MALLEVHEFSSSSSLSLAARLPTSQSRSSARRIDNSFGGHCATTAPTEEGRSDETEQEDDATDEEQRQRDEKNKKSVVVATTRLAHHLTVCMVPPECAERVWDTVTRCRTELRDPGLFRWPPHVNLLYPFVDCYVAVADDDDVDQPVEMQDDGSNDTFHDPSAEETPVASPTKPKKKSKVLDADVLGRLSVACRSCEPFRVRLRSFGTFGGSRRGVLWLHPESFRKRDDDDGGGGELNCGMAKDQRNERRQEEQEEPSPLVQLQAALAEQFPMCTQQAKAHGRFNPHMTVSHFANLEEALSGQKLVEEESSWWSGNQLEFEVNEIYMLQRKGDDGQFMKLATFSLGVSGTGGCGYTLHNTANKPTLERFGRMPSTEADWVRDERMKLKARRNKGSRRRRRRKRGEQRQDDPSSEDAIVPP